MTRKKGPLNGHPRNFHATRGRTQKFGESDRGTISPKQTTMARGENVEYRACRGKYHRQVAEILPLNCGESRKYGAVNI